MTHSETDYLYLNAYNVEQKQMCPALESFYYVHCNLRGWVACVYLSLYMHCGMYIFESIYACEVLKEKYNTLGESAFGMRIVTLVPLWVGACKYSNLCMHVQCLE